MIGMIILYVAACISLFIMASAIGNQKQEIAKLSLKIQRGLELAKMELDLAKTRCAKEVYEIRVDIAKVQRTAEATSLQSYNFRRNGEAIELILNALGVEMCDIPEETKLITKKTKQKEGAKDDR